MTVDDLKRAIDALPIADRIHLLRQYGTVNDADFSLAEVTFVDSGAKGDTTPHAIIKYKDGSEECINIIESVKTNAASIGHPAILLAIHWWENIVRRELALKPTYVVTDYEYVEAAKRNLRRLGSVLLEGAEVRKLSKEDAFALFVRTWDLDHPRSNLKIAWELLGEDDLKDCSEPQRLGHLVKRLRKKRTLKVDVETIGIILRARYLLAGSLGSSER